MSSCILIQFLLDRQINWILLSLDSPQFKRRSLRSILLFYWLFRLFRLLKSLHFRFYLSVKVDLLIFGDGFKRLSIVLLIGYNLFLFSGSCCSFTKLDFCETVNGCSWLDRYYFWLIVCFNALIFQFSSQSSIYLIILFVYSLASLKSFNL
jgi:hypothetical protein